MILFSGCLVIIGYASWCSKWLQRSKHEFAGDRKSDYDAIVPTIAKKLFFCPFCPISLHVSLIIIEFRLQPSFWSSASSEGLFCASERSFTWCTSGNYIDDASVKNPQLWNEAPTGNESLANCVSLGLSKNENSAELSLAACTESKPFMCQV